MGKVKQALRLITLVVINLYRYAISPFFPPSCRFLPTCSAYAQQAVEQHGAVKGTCLALKRVCKCHPWHPGGVDLVPPVASKINQTSQLKHDNEAVAHD